MHTTRIKLPVGEFTAHFSERGLTRLEFPRSPRKPAQPWVAASPSPLPREAARWHRLTEQALRRALDGKQPKLLPPLDLSAGTAFQQEVWHALQRIGTGETKSYSEVAGAVGKPKAARAVGGACGANPIPVLIPCHRVLASGGGLGGFSGGLNWKTLLLANEGVRVAQRTAKSDGKNSPVGRQRNRK